MEPQLEKSSTPGLALPQPSVEGGGQTAFGGPEIAPSGEGLLQPVASAPLAVATVAPAAPSQMTMPRPDPAAMQTPPVAIAPERVEELDRESIDRAKAIVERTKADPFQKSNELSQAKADYLRLRYNKHIKVAEEQTK